MKKMAALLIAIVAFLAGMHTQAQNAQPQIASLPAKPVYSSLVAPAQDPDETTPAPVPAAGYNPLRIKTVMRFPAKVKTLRDSTVYLLEPINYKLLDLQQSARLLARPILPSANNGDLRTIEDALLEIAGDDAVLVVDHAHKLVTFELKQPAKPQ